MTRMLRRNTKNKIIGGVASGLSEYFQIELWIIRLIFILLLCFGAGVLIYIIMWIVIPENNLNDDNMEVEYEKNYNYKKSNGDSNGNIMAGIILITLGILFLIERYITEIHFRDLWPWILVVVGILILIKGLRKN